MINSLKVFHLCLYCFKRNPVVLEDHPAEKCNRKPLAMFIEVDEEAGELLEEAASD